MVPAACAGCTMPRRRAATMAKAGILQGFFNVGAPFSTEGMLE
jgi:hypothetical protein